MTRYINRQNGIELDEMQIWNQSVVPRTRPHVQGKRNPNKVVGTERGDQRADRLKLQSQTTSQSDHMDHSLV